MTKDQHIEAAEGWLTIASKEFGNSNPAHAQTAATIAHGYALLAIAAEPEVRVSTSDETEV